MAFLGHSPSGRTGYRTALLSIRRRRFLAVCLCVAFLSCSTIGSKAQEGVSEYEVKAAFLFNFAKFVDWPQEAFADERAPVVICILGQNPFNGSLDRGVSGKTINGRSIVVKNLAQGEDPRSCHVLFVSSSEKKRLAQILVSLAGASVLTIGEADDFLGAGGVIKLVMENNRVRFDVNTAVAGQARLRISSKLLQLARTVIR
jgi:hypothetical protein